MATIAAQNFNGLNSSGTFTTDSFPVGSILQPLTNTSAVNLSGPGIGFQTFWTDTRGNEGPLNGSESGDFIGVNSFGGSNAPDVGADGTAVSDGVEQNFEFNDGDGRLDLTFDAIDLSGFNNRTFSFNYWINDTGFESNDTFTVTLSDGVNTATVLSFSEPELEGNASADDGSANWNTVNFDLESAIATAGLDASNVGLTISADTNAGSENIFVDDILFAGDATSGGGGGTSDLFFSEYVEGSSFNKAVEIANLTGADVDLSDYSLEIYFNGNTTPGTTLDLSGTVTDGDVYVIADDGADAAILSEADFTPSSNFFNGDDAVVLRKGGAVVDAIGQIGVDPGSEWGSGDVSTQNNTLRRQDGITSGDTNPDDAFDPAAEWEGFAQDTFDGLGSLNGDGGSGGGGSTAFGIQESFETAPGTTYTLSDAFDNGGFAYFDRYAVPDDSNAARDDFQVGWDGDFGIQGQDHDAEGGAATRTISIDDINIAGGDNVFTTISLAALASEPAFDNYEVADGDGIQIFATVDGGARTLIGAFAPPADGAGDLLLDTDLDGVGDSDRLNADLQDFSFAVGQVGNSLDLDIELTSTGGFEPLAVDNVRVEEVIDFQESFETAPGTTYTLSDAFDNGGFAYFDRYAVPDDSNAARDDFQVGWDGDFGIQGQDHDAEGGAATRTISINDIDIANGQELFTTISLAALASEPAFDNYEAADNDGIQIFARVDGGARTLIGAFAPPADGAGDLFLDTDLDGVGDGARLNADLQDFSFAIAETGNSLDLEIELTSTGGFEPLAVDNVRVGSGGIDEEGPTGPAQEAAIYEIQGAGHTSPFNGENVITTGIVTAVAGNGFYLQDPTGDGDNATSDAIFVFTSSAPGVSVGDELEVEGIVDEFFPGGSSTGNLSTTEITDATFSVLSSGNALPASVILGAAGRIPPAESIDDDAFASFDPDSDGIDFFESLEGMRVTANDPLAVSATDDNGEIFTVVDNGANASGLSDRKTLNISPDDFNPEKVQIDVNGSLLPGFDTPEVNVGTQFSDVTGVISYNFGNFELQPTETFSVVTPSDLKPEVTNLKAGADQLTVASYNVLNLDPNDADGNTDVANGQFEAVAAQIVNNLKSPDVIGLQEIQDNSGSADTGEVSASETLQRLVDEIAAAGGPQYEFIDNTFIGDQTNGGDPAGNIRTAFLYNPDRVDLVEGSVQPVGDQEAGSPYNGARLPLSATFSFNGEDLTLINNHFSSKGGSAPIFGVEQPFAERQEDVSVNGSLDERQAQATGVKEFIEDLLASSPDAKVVALGDLNEFEFVSPVEILEEAGLNNLTNTLDANERYSFIFQGNSQSLDHILATDNLFDGAQFDIVHTNTELAESDPSRASDHDPLVASFTIANPIEGGFGRDVLTGTDGVVDRFISSRGSDVLTGGEGRDQFSYSDFTHLGDFITDFNPSEDQIVLTELFESLGISSNDPLADSTIGFRDFGNNTALLLDRGGPGASPGVPYVRLLGVNGSELSAENFVV